MPPKFSAVVRHGASPCDQRQKSKSQRSKSQRVEKSKGRRVFSSSCFLYLFYFLLSLIRVYLCDLWFLYAFSFAPIRAIRGRLDFGFLILNLFRPVSGGNGRDSDFGFTALWVSKYSELPSANKPLTQSFAGFPYPSQYTASFTRCIVHSSSQVFTHPRY